MRGSLPRSWTSVPCNAQRIAETVRRQRCQSSRFMTYGVTRTNRSSRRKKTTPFAASTSRAPEV